MTANISDIVEVHEKASSTTLSLTAFLLLFVGWKGGRAVSALHNTTCIFGNS